MTTTSYGRKGRSIDWPTLVMLTLGFWLSASLLLDLVIMPSLSASGMMAQNGFASAGYALFGLFNRIELVCAALVLSGFLIFNRNHTLVHLRETWSIALAGILFAIPLIYTYILTPQMSGLGLNLNILETVQTMPTGMIYLHEGYWLLEGIKFLAGLTLLRWCYRDSCRII
jgi:UDP-N-acetylmuramyl pentapeptide phosphotransferase/UDP-N-acetylglucosamine-1-phosphate transferase